MKNVNFKNIALKKVKTWHKRLRKIKSCAKSRAIKLYTKHCLLNQNLGCRRVKFGLKTVMYLVVIIWLFCETAMKKSYEKFWS